MEFTPHLKRKKGANQKWAVTPFPSVTDDKHFRGIFTGLSVEVQNRADILAIYQNGCYGKGSQSRGAPQFITQGNGGRGVDDALESQLDRDEETLVLALEEACFLAYYLEVLHIYDLRAQPLNWTQFSVACEKLNPNFQESLAAYLYLKSKGWVVKSGIKFGGEFMIYKKGPRFYHASFVVFLTTPANSGSHFAAKDIKGLQRIAETSDKDVLLLEVTKPQDFQPQTPAQYEAIQISETIVRRFNYTGFVQNHKPTK